MKKRMRVVMWHHQLDVDELNEAIAQFKRPHLIEIDTQSSDYAIAIGERGCTQEDAQAAWDALGDED